MTETDLQALERFVVDNDELLALEAMIGSFNVFDALRIARAEIRHSNFLCWLLSPEESHGQGDRFLKAVLMDILSKARHQDIVPPLSAVELDGATLEGVEIRREWRNIDLLITCEKPRFVVAIENKVDSGEHSDQLQRYEDIVAAEFRGARSLFVFLTPEGDEPSDEDWVTYSYADLHRVLLRTRSARASTIGSDVGLFLDHYLSLIGNKFMENEELDKLCRQIYTNHRQALDLIWERVGSPASELIGGIQRWIEERSADWTIVKTRSRAVEFIPSTWNKMLPPVGKRPAIQPDHWITFRLHAQKKKLSLLGVVCPTTDPAIRKTATERLIKDKNEFGFTSNRKELTDRWTRILTVDVCPLSEDEEPEVEPILERVEATLNALLKPTAGVPAAMKDLFGGR